MLNEIYVKDSMIKMVDRIKEKRYTWLVFDDGTKMPTSELLGQAVMIKCHDCKSLFETKFFTSKPNIFERAYLCHSCSISGPRNGFYGKKHSKKFKERLSKERKGKWCVGQDNAMFGVNIWDTFSDEKAEQIRDKKRKSVLGTKNPFYGKTHTEDVIKSIAEKNREWQSKLSKEEKKIISSNLSAAQKRIYQRNPDEYIKNKIKAAKISCSSHKRYSMNKIETTVMKELENRGLMFQYSVILDYKQFDFGNKKHRILLEVQGDYWHGNPKIYGENRKKKLNHVQIKNKTKDRLKVKFAKKHGFKLFKIWESDIRNKDFSAIDKIEEIMNVDAF